MSSGVYKTRLITDTVYQEGWRDGIKASYYQGKIHVTGGWHPDKVPIMSSRHYTLDPISFVITKLPDALWSGRHTHGQGVYNDKLWVWGWSSNPVGHMDLWSYNGTWKSELPNWQFPKRVHFASHIFKGHAYVFGGANIDDTVYYNDVIRIDLNNILNGWQKVGDFPNWMQKLDCGCLFDFENALYYLGGGELINTGGEIRSTIPFTKVCKSIGGGSAWTEVTDNPILNSMVWGNVAANDEAVFCLSGSDKDNDMENNNRLFMSYDCKQFEYLNRTLPHRHASGMCADDKGNIHIIMGNGNNDWWKIKKIADTKQYYN